MDDVPADLSSYIEAVHDWSTRKGWFDPKTGPRPFEEEVVLFHSEVSEAVEEWRNGHDVRDVYYNPDRPDKPEGIPIELADVLIRTFDAAGARTVPIVIHEGFRTALIPDVPFLHHMLSLHGIISLSSQMTSLPGYLSLVVASTFHVVKFFGIDIWSAYNLKMTYNETREFRHGGKRA